MATWKWRNFDSNWGTCFHERQGLSQTVYTGTMTIVLLISNVLICCLSSTRTTNQPTCHTNRGQELTDLRHSLRSSYSKSLRGRIDIITNTLEIGKNSTCHSTFRGHTSTGPWSVLGRSTQSWGLICDANLAYIPSNLFLLPTRRMLCLVLAQSCKDSTR